MKSENPPIFSAFALSVSCIVVASLVLFALLLFFVGCGCVVGGSFSLWTIATKRRGAPRWRVLSSCVVGLLCKTGLSVFVKFVIISLYFLGYTFIGV